MKKATLLFISILYVLFSYSQLPQSFKYQAAARATDGALLDNQLVSFRISILQSSPTGAVVYSESHQFTTNDYGLASLAIGEGVVISGIFSSIDWSLGPYYLKVELDATGGSSYQFMGTSQLLSVPYALYSENTSNTDDADADPLNEIQTISKGGSTVTLSNNGGFFTDETEDADADPTNEYNTEIQLNGNLLEVTDAGGTISVDIGTLAGDSDWTIAGDDMYSNAAGNVAIGTTTNSTYAKLSVGGHISIVNSGRSIFIGAGAGLNDDLTLNDNVFIGEISGQSNITGNQNIAIGRGTFGNNVSGFENTALGSGSMWDNLDGNYNTATGRLSLYGNTSGSKNAAIGYAALYVNETGNNNTAVGSDALRLITGSNNTALGFEAGKSVIGTSMSGSVFLGYRAGKNEISSNKLYIENSDSDTPLIYGDFSTDYLKINGKLEVAGRINISNTGNSVFLGSFAGYNDDLTDNYNVFIGQSSGIDNTSGDNNTATGGSSLSSNTIGSSNSSFGRLSLRDNTQGSDNTAIGSAAMIANTIGDDNTAIGKAALALNNNGNKNTALGFEALYYTVSGNNNTAIGYRAGFGSTGMSVNGCVYLGYQAGYFNDSDNKLFIDNSTTSSPLIYGDFGTNEVVINGQMGVGTESPAVNFHVDGTSDASLSGGGLFISGDLDGENIVMDGNEIMARNNGAISSLHVQRNGGAMSLHYDMIEIYEFIVGADGKTGIGENTPSAKLHLNTNTAEDALRIQVEGLTKFKIASNGGVALSNATAPAFALELQNSSVDLIGRARAYSWNTYSDNRLKSNQRELKYGLKEVMQLQPKSYDHHSSSTSEEGDFVMVTNQKIATVGFIAQEVQQIIPEAVNEPADESKDLWSMDYDKLIPVLTKAIQEQQEIINDLKSRILELEKVQ